MDKEWVDEDDMMIADLYKEQERRKNRRKELMKIVEHAPILEILEKECKERLDEDKQIYVNETILKAEWLQHSMIHECSSSVSRHLNLGNNERYL